MQPQLKLLSFFIGLAVKSKGLCPNTRGGKVLRKLAVFKSKNNQKVFIMVLIKVFVLYKEGEGFLSATNIGAPYYWINGWAVLGKMWEDVYFDFKAYTYGWVMDKDADHSTDVARHMFNMYLKGDRKKA